VSEIGVILMRKLVAWATGLCCLHHLNQFGTRWEI